MRAFGSGEKGVDVASIRQDAVVSQALGDGGGRLRQFQEESIIAGNRLCDRQDGRTSTVSKSIRDECAVTLPLVSIANAEQVFRIRSVPLELCFCRDCLATDK